MPGVMLSHTCPENLHRLWTHLKILPHIFLWKTAHLELPHRRSYDYVLVVSLATALSQPRTHVMPRFVPRQRKHKVLARQHTSKTDPTLLSPAQDSNAAIILPSDQAAKEEKKRKLKEELRAQQPHVSSKKQKRLDKYIDNKLKKDENLEYLRLLEQEQEKVDAVRAKSVTVTSECLGKRKFEEFANGTLPKNGDTTEQDRMSDVESEDSFEAEHKEVFENSEDTLLPVRSTVQQGSGLAQPLQIGEDGLPVIKTKQRRKKRRKLELQQSAHENEESEWAGLSDDEDDQPAREAEGGMSLEQEIMDELRRRGAEVGYESDDSRPSNEEDQSGNLHDLSEPEDDDSSSGSESSTSATSAEDDDKSRSSVFKAWATQQLNKSIGHTPSYEITPENLKNHQTPTERPSVYHPTLALQRLSTSSKTTRKAYSIRVQRTEELQQARNELPIIQREQEIMEAIHNNSAVIVKGDTGSGKTTQVPQFLYESGYGSPDGPTPGMIGITQPRRVAAVSMAKRVGDELGDHRDKVSYQIRFDSTVSSRTAVKFMTDGILLRELSEDLLLRKYSVIIIDEAHERSVNTDILIGLLSKIVPARMKRNQFNPDPKPLKLIIMSATLNIGEFVNDRLFSAGQKPPIVEVEGRQHRVTTHFALRSRADYLEEVVEKVQRAHRKLPKGGMLVFLTGQNEIRQVQSRLQTLLKGRPAEENLAKVHDAASEVPFEVEDMELEAANYDVDQDDFDEVEILTYSDDEAEEDEFDVSDDEDVQQPTTESPNASSKDPYTSVHVLPLYSQLPTKEQLRVFEPAPPGARLIVLATNVAETSLTIPGIRYVFDTGRSKERKYNLNNRVQSFEIDYISKASAAQRAGRAGRTGPGHCWRLYTSAVYERFFPEHALPEILRSPAESVVLQLKSFAYPKPIVEFPFPSAPSMEALQKAERLLKNLGALTPSGAITDLGKELSVYPLSPRLGKIVSSGNRDVTLLPHLLSLVAALAVAEIFGNEPQLDVAAQEQDQEQEVGDEAKNDRKQAYGRARAILSRQDGTSDAVKLLTATLMYNASEDKEQLCKDYFLRPKAMFEVSQLQRQLTAIVKSNNPASHNSLNQRSKLSSKQIKQLNTIAASGYIDQVAIRADLSPNPPDLPSKPRRAIDVPYLPLIPLSHRTSASLLEKAIFIHPSSVLARHPHKGLPPFITYTHLQRSQPQHINTEVSATKTRMFPLAPIDRQQLVDLAKYTALLELGKPVSNSKLEEIKGTPKRRECWLTAELRGGAGFGWPMPPVRVRQVMDVKTASGWRVEEWL
jgi:ATP-dependent RNA helicase DHX37/DHR1